MFTRPNVCRLRRARAFRVGLCAPVIFSLALGPVLPVALRADSEIRTYRPPPGRGIDDVAESSGLFPNRGAGGSGDSGGSGGGGGGSPGSGGGVTPGGTPEQRKAALKAVLDANDGGIPPPDSDRDGFSDYEEEFKKNQLKEAGVGLGDRIATDNAAKRPPAYRYAIVDLGKKNRPISISAKNGWVLLSPYSGRFEDHAFPEGLSVWHLGAVYAYEGEYITPLPGISDSGRVMATNPYRGPQDDAFGILKPVAGAMIVDFEALNDGPGPSHYSGDLYYGGLAGDTRYRVVGGATLFRSSLWHSGPAVLPNGDCLIGLCGVFSSAYEPMLLGVSSPAVGSASASFKKNYEGVVPSGGQRRPWYYDSSDAAVYGTNDYDRADGCSGVDFEFFTDRGVRLVFSSDASKQALGRRMVAGGAYALGHKTDLFFQGLSNDGVAVGLTWGLREGNVGKFMRFTQSDACIDLPNWATDDATERRWVSINSPSELKRQIVVAGHQIWRRKLDEAGGVITPVEFDEPEDLRHLIEFSEPWLDLAATGVSDEGFIVGVGKKINDGKQKPIEASASAKKPYLDAGLSPAHYGPTDPEKCGLWDHDVKKYTEGADYEEHAFMLIPIALRTDADRDGAIRADGTDSLGAGIPWRFWVNDDADEGDFRNPEAPLADVPGKGTNNNEGEAAAEGAKIHGRADWIDWFPVYMDAKPLMEACETIPGNPLSFVFNQADTALHITYGKFAPSEQRKFQTEDQGSSFGLELAEPKAAASACKVAATALLGTPIPGALTTAIKAETGHALAAGLKKTRAPLRLSIRGYGDTELAAVRLPLSIEPLYVPGRPNSFFRWVNLRSVLGGSESQPTNISEPVNWPDVATNQKNMIFIHGYDCDETLALTSAEYFKRLFWSESRSMMTLVTWYGNPPSAGSGTLLGAWAGIPSDYYGAVRRAFQTAPHLAGAVNALPGTRSIAAHSLGNMVVSSALQYHGLQVDHYVQLNAAVPCEAYDQPSPAMDSGLGYLRKPRGDEMRASSYVASMREPGWVNFPPQCYASEFHTLFPTSDMRSGLTWRGVFASIHEKTTVHCYYSSKEEVLCQAINAPWAIDTFWGAAWNNMTGKIGWMAWLVQEWRKGSSGVTNQLVTTADGRGHGGWDKSGRLASDPGPGGSSEWQPATSTEFAGVSDIALRNNGAFTHFSYGAAHNPRVGSFSYVFPGGPEKPHLLSSQIPALSDAIGCMPSKVRRDAEKFEFKNMNNDFKEGWPAARINTGDRFSGWWFHGDFKDVAYRYNYKLYDRVVEALGLKEKP